MRFRNLLLPALAVAMLAGVPACAPAAVTPGAPTTVKFPFGVGKTWTYDMTVTNPDLPQPLTGTATLQLTKLEGTNATFKLTTNLPPAPESSSEFTGSTAGNPYSQGSPQGASSQETITVPAGTFNVTKEVTRETTGGSDSTTEIWYNEANGMVKMVTTSTEGGKTTISTMVLK